MYPPIKSYRYSLSILLKKLIFCFHLSFIYLFFFLSVLIIFRGASCSLSTDIVHLSRTLSVLMPLFIDYYCNETSRTIRRYMRPPSLLITIFSIWRLIYQYLWNRVKFQIVLWSIVLKKETFKEISFFFEILKNYKGLS